MTDEYDWMLEARGIAAQCWGDPETEFKVMDPILCEAVAKRIATWMQIAARNANRQSEVNGNREMICMHMAALLSLLLMTGKLELSDEETDGLRQLLADWETHRQRTQATHLDLRDSAC